MDIMIPISGRSDAGLVAPIIKRLKAAGDCVVSGYISKDSIPHNGGFDVALICGDRVEQTAFAFKCFLQHIPIAHLYSGVSNNLATFDDINRHCITLWSDIQFVESHKAWQTVRDLFEVIGKPCDLDTFRCYNVGITHLDDLAVDEPDIEFDYDLVLYNPPTLMPDMETELNQIESMIKGHTAIFISPNNDEKRNVIIERFNTYSPWPMQNYSRPQFLGLLKNCRRFITNSSCAVYEAPYFLRPDQIIHIGDRNLHRDKGPFATGASDKIVKILHELYGEKK